MKQNLLKILEQKMPNFSKGHKAVAEYIINHYDKAAFMTASVLGDTVGVSESTVVRFASALGFDGYPKLQQALEELIKNRLTTAQRLDVTSEQMLGGDVLTRIINLDIDKLRRTCEEVSRKDFDGALEAFLKAKNIYIVGVRSSFAIAQFVYYYFNQIFENVRLINATGNGEMFEQIFRINENDVIFGISFPRYSKKTVKAVKYAKEKGAKVVALTDINTSPLAEFADYTLLARSDMASFADSLVAPMSIVNSLLVAIGIRKREEIKDTYSALETIWEEYDVFDKSEGNTK